VRMRRVLRRAVRVTGAPKPARVPWR
jgi:hypothetical protein